MRTDLIRDMISGSLREGADVRMLLIDRCTDAILEATQLVYSSIRSGRKVLLFGNGGSAADAQHIAAEFVGRFVRERDPLPAMALTANSSTLTAVANDYGFERVFARQVWAFGLPGDVAIAISTSGKSPNVLEGVKTARDRGLKIIGLTGADGFQLAELVDVAVIVPSTVTARIQECHIALGHVLCEAVEALLAEPNLSANVPRAGSPESGDYTQSQPMSLLRRGIPQSHARQKNGQI